MTKQNEPQASSFPSAAPKLDDSLLKRLWVLANKPVILVVIWLGAIMHLAAVFAKLPQRAAQTDFSVYYTSATMLRAGLNPYTTDITPAARRLGLDVGPLTHDDSMPFFLLCFAPLTRLSPKAAYWVWFGTNSAVLALVIVLLLQGLGRGKLLLAALMLPYQPVAEHFAYARTEILILLMLVLMLHWLEEGHDGAAGLILALAGALRAFPLVLAGYLLLRGQWRALFYTAVGLAIISIITVAMLGLPLCASFVNGALFSAQYQFAAMFLDVSLSAFVSRLFWYPMGPHLGHSLEVLRGVAVVSADLAVLVLTIRVTLASSDKSRAFSLWIVTSILLSPIAWVHYMVLVFILFAQLALAASQGRCSDRAIWAMLASYVLLKIPNDLLEMARHRHSPVFFFGIGELYFFTLVLAYLSAYWLAADSGESMAALAEQSRETTIESRGV
jgi:Glycosyltransferase family 87